MHRRPDPACVLVKNRVDFRLAAPTVAAEPTGARGLDEVDALDELVFVGETVEGRLVVERNQAWVEVRRGVEFFHQLHGRGVEPIPRNHVARKPLRAVERIIDRSGNLGEVSVAHLHRRYSEELTPQPALFEPLEVRHEEKPVLPVVDLRQPNRTAQREAVLVPLKRLSQAYTRKCILARIELVVAKELEHRSVKLVCPGLGRNIDLRRGAPELGRKDSSLNLELLQRIDGWQEDIGVEIHVGILHAVQGEVVELAALARDRNVLLGALSPLPSNGLSGIREAVAYVGAHRDKLQEVASVQRHFHDLLVFDHCPDRRVLRGDESRRALDLDRLAHISNLEREVNTRGELDLQLDVILRYRAEAWQFHFHVVSARLQRGKVVNARLVTNSGADEVRGRIRHRDGDAGNDRARRVMNHPAYTRLRLGHRGQDAQENHKPNRPGTAAPHSSSVLGMGILHSSLAKLLPDENNFARWGRGTPDSDSEIRCALRIRTEASARTGFAARSSRERFHRRSREPAF